MAEPAPSSQPKPHDRTGEVIADRYELVGHLDKGGQGAVYRARDRKTDEEVAVKILHQAIAADPEWRERMFREARAMASLHGTAAVRIFDQQWTDDGALCLVMELLHGADLESWLQRIERAGAKFPVSALVPILEPVVQTLEVAHSQGIIHRDLKPANIFIADVAHGGQVKLLDFGFAKFTNLPSFTRDGFIAGSPSYVAPEAWMGRNDLDRRIDVYAIGSVIFRAVAGRPPFVSPHLGQLLHKVTSDERPKLTTFRPELPVAIDDWVKQAIAIEPVDRFLTVRGMWLALRSILRI